MSDFDRYSLTIARWLTNVYDADDPAGKPTTPGDVTHRGHFRLFGLPVGVRLAG
ncbi:hypothetical protein [Microbacterium aurum]